MRPFLLLLAIAPNRLFLFYLLAAALLQLLKGTLTKLLLAALGLSTCGLRSSSKRSRRGFDAPSGSQRELQIAHFVTIWAAATLQNQDEVVEAEEAVDATSE